jgi:hypothetical protein
LEKEALKKQSVYRSTGLIVSGASTSFTTGILMSMKCRCGIAFIVIVVGWLGVTVTEAVAVALTCSDGCFKGITDYNDGAGTDYHLTAGTVCITNAVTAGATAPCPLKPKDALPDCAGAGAQMRAVATNALPCCGRQTTVPTKWGNVIAETLPNKCQQGTGT